MNIKEILRDLVAYYAATGRVGHSTALMEGVANTESVAVIIPNYRHARALAAKAPKALPVPVGNLQLLKGQRTPLVIDNQVIEMLLSEALAEIERLEFQCDTLSEARRADDCPQCEPNRVEV